MKNRSSFLFPLIPAILLTALFEYLCQKEVIPAFLLPAPSNVLKAFLEDFDGFKKAFFETTEASGYGLLLSVFVGLLTALVLAISKTIRLMFYPYAIFFQTVPIIAIAPLLVIWLGYGLPTVVASAFIVSVFPVIANSVLGLQSTDPALLNLFKLLGASEWKTLFQLRLPAALPQIMGGVKISAGLSVIGAIVGEFISGSGLGGLVDAARNQQRIDRVFASVLLAAFLGILFFSLISFLNRLALNYSNRN